MKIVSIGPAAPLRGGIAKFNESFALACKRSGHTIDIVSFRFLYPGFLFPGKTQFTDDPGPSGITVYTWLHPLNPLNWVHASQKISRLKPDLVVFHYWMPFFAPVMGFTARCLRKKSKAKILAIAHNLIPHEKQLFSRALSSWFTRSIQGMICLSGSVLDDLQNLQPNLPGIKLFHPVYDIYGTRVTRKEAAEELKLDPGYRYLLFFGLIRKYKGLELLLRSFAQIQDRNLRLVVAGEFYEPKKYYTDLAEKLGITNSVFFTDSFIPDDQVRYYFSLADLVVQPYLTATQSGVTQIAHHFGCPSIVTNTGGLAETITDGVTGFVCDHDPGNIAGKIRLFFENNRADEMKENIRKESGRFSWDSFTAEFVGFTNQITS